MASTARQRIEAARDRAEEAAARFAATDPVVDPRPPSAPLAPRPRRVAVGDPQAPLEVFLEVLARRGLISERGWLEDDVQLVSLGDQFDWGAAEQRARAAREAFALLSWLVAHPPDQVVVLAGNHDLSRVGELADLDDEEHDRALAMADAAWRGGETDREAEADFLAAFPCYPSALVAARDLGSFRSASRDLVVRCLRARRLQAAVAVEPDVVLTHAGVTRSQLERARGLVGEPSGTGPGVALAEVLERCLRRAVDGWTSGRLELPGLHRAGSAAGGPGAGVFYQNPAHPETPEAAGGFQAPERFFDPRDLPPGVVQVVGHVRDSKCRRLLGPWVAGEPTGGGQLRTLDHRGGQVRYYPGPPAAARTPDLARMVFVDGEMNAVPPEDYQLLDLDTLRAL